MSIGQESLGADEISGIEPQGSALQQVLLAHEAGDEDQMILALQELCTTLCVGGEIFLRRLIPSDYVGGLLHLILVEDSEPVQILVMRALGLVADLVPRAASCIVDADGVPILIATFVDRLHLLNNDGYRDDLFKCLEVVSFEGHEQIVAENGLEHLLLQVDVGDDHQRYLVVTTIVNIFGLATQDEAEYFGVALPKLFSLLQSKLEQILRHQGPRSGGIDAVTTPLRHTMPRHLRMREEDVALKLMSCFAHFIDRIVVTADKFKEHSAVLGNIADLCTAVMLDSRNTLQEDAFRLASISIISSLYLTAPKAVVALLERTSMIQAVCSITLRLIEESMSLPSFGLDEANTTPTNESNLEDRGGNPALDPNRTNGGDSASRLGLHELSVSLLLEFLLLIIPAAPDTVDAFNVSVPFFAWQWVDDYRNKTDYEEDFSRRLENEYQLQRDGGGNFTTFDLFHVSRPCSIRFRTMSCCHGSIEALPRPIIRTPLCSGFLHRPAMGLLFDLCTCAGSTPTLGSGGDDSQQDDDDSHGDLPHAANGSSSQADPAVMREWILECRRRVVERRRHRIEPITFSQLAPPAATSSTSSIGCCCLRRFFPSSFRSKPKAMPTPSADQLLAVMPSEAVRYRDVREEILLDPGLRSLYINHRILGPIVKNCLPMLFTVVRCSVSQVVSRHATILLLRCISLAKVLDEHEARHLSASCSTSSALAASITPNQCASATPVQRVTKNSEANAAVLESVRAMSSDVLLALAGIVKGSSSDIVNRSTATMLAASPGLAHSSSAARGSLGSVGLMHSRRDGTALVSIAVPTVQGEMLVAGCTCLLILSSFLPSAGTIRAVFTQQRVALPLQVASIALLREITAATGSLHSSLPQQGSCSFHTARVALFRDMAHVISRVIQELEGSSSSGPLGTSLMLIQKNCDDDDVDDDRGDLHTVVQRSDQLGILSSPSVKSLPVLPDSGAMEQLLQLMHLVVQHNVPLADVHRRNPTYFGMTARAMMSQLHAHSSVSSTTSSSSNMFNNVPRAVQNQLQSLCVSLVKTVGSHVTFANSILTESVAISRMTPSTAKAAAATQLSPVLQCMADRLTRPLRLRFVPLPFGGPVGNNASPPAAPPGANDTDHCANAAPRHRDFWNRSGNDGSFSGSRDISIGGFQFLNCLPLENDVVERLMSAYPYVTLRALARELLVELEEDEAFATTRRRMMRRHGSHESQCMCAMLGGICEYCEARQSPGLIPLDDMDGGADDDDENTHHHRRYQLTEDNVVFILDGKPVLDPSTLLLDALVCYTSGGSALRKLLENPFSSSRTQLHRAMNTWVTHHTLHFVVLEKPPPLRPSPNMCCSYQILKGRHRSPSMPSPPPSMPIALSSGGSARPSSAGQHQLAAQTTEYMCSPRHIYTRLKASSGTHTDVIDECLQLLEASLAVLRLPAHCLALGLDARRLCNALLHEITYQSLSFVSPCLAPLCHLGVHRETPEDSLASYALWNYPQIFPVELRHTIFDVIVQARRQVLPRPISIPIGSRGVVGGEWAIGQDTSSSNLKKLKCRARRGEILEDGESVLLLHEGCPLPLELSFEGEPGTGLGPTLEFYNCLCRELQKQALGLWRSTSEAEYFSDQQPLFPSPKQTPSLRRYYTLLGRIIARLLLESKTFNLHLHPLIYKRLLGQDLMRDASSALFSLDPQLENSLQQLLSMTREDLVALDMRFVVPGHDNIELLPGGSEQVVDVPCVHSFVDGVRRYYLVKCLDAAVDPILTGMTALFAPANLLLFSAEELVLRLRGVEGKLWYTRAQLEDNLRTDHGYTMASSSIGYFLNVVSSWDAQRQRLFLRFISGSDRLPVGGLTPPITVVRKDPDADATPSRASRMRAAAAAAVSAANARSTTPNADQQPVDSVTPLLSTPPRLRYTEEYQEHVDESLPTVNTCFHYLKLPQYSTQEILEERLLFAIQEGQESFMLS